MAFWGKTAAIAATVAGLLVLGGCSVAPSATRQSADNQVHASSSTSEDSGDEADGSSTKPTTYTASEENMLSFGLRIDTTFGLETPDEQWLEIQSLNCKVARGLSPDGTDGVQFYVPAQDPAPSDWTSDDLLEFVVAASILTDCPRSIALATGWTGLADKFAILRGETRSQPDPESQAEPDATSCAGMKDFNQYYQEALERNGISPGGSSPTNAGAACSTITGGDSSTTTDGGTSTGDGSSTYTGGGSSVACSDGWISNSGGKQGACSHHGGVSG